jgi:hypothetical protein
MPKVSDFADAASLKQAFSAPFGRHAKQEWRAAPIAGR